MAPRLMAAHRLFHAAEAGHHHRADFGIAGERRVEHVHAVGVGQAQIDDQRVVGKAGQPFHRVLGVGRLRHGKPLAFQRFGDQFTQRGFVFDDEDGRGGSLGHGVLHVPAV